MTHIIFRLSTIFGKLVALNSVAIHHSPEFNILATIKNLFKIPMGINIDNFCSFGNRAAPRLLTFGVNKVYSILSTTFLMFVH